ncbi:alpha/beta hydrolase [Amycolatopsis sp. PS_44_ISF1]|uniref:alpha/beta hydrolase n=1 Tax=Amycolatopsis sp. PS_44_ISF1 TaxID=2974917 RepID=UPI0028DFE3FF|nr:alpha/beta hydrolase [Amycolatopsis sp. PS_44_ISF1]MDT8913279.1 alpha/beta hydrolase [Amycolatopsis sp. PS_44_ISF1]
MDGEPVLRHSQGVAGWARTPDGRELYFQRRPGRPARRDGPTVVFEGGLAAGRSYWATVQGEVAKWASSVVYDRSGLGRSPADPGPRPLAKLAADLGALLDHLGPGPYLLAGHSWGGPIARIAAAARPERIAGLVLVDPTDEACELLFRPSTRRVERIGQVVSSALARAGLLAVAHRELLASLPADARADLRAEGFTPAAMRTRAAELASVAADLTALRDHPVDRPELPLTVISAGLASAGMNRRVRAEVDASHAHRVGLARHGRHVHAHRSGHLVPMSEPGLIAEEIRRLAVG